MRITFVTRKFGNVERNSHCDVLHITPVRVARLVLDCSGVFAIKSYCHVFSLCLSVILDHRLGVGVERRQHETIKTCKDDR